MRVFNVITVALYALGTLAFGALVLDFASSWVARRRDARNCAKNDWVGGAMLLVSFLWFLIHLLLQFAIHTPAWSGQNLQLVQIFLMFSFPPLIGLTLLSDVNSRATDTDDKRGLLKWKLPVALFFVASLGVLAWIFLAISGVIDVSGRTIGWTIGISISALFGFVSIFAIVVMTIFSRGQKESADERGARRSISALFGVMIVVVVFLLLSFFSDASLGHIMRVVASSMPLLFIFTDLYHANRFEFFDVFVKRGVALVLTLTVLASWFALALPLLDVYREQYIGPWLLAVAALPMAVAVPWAFGKLSQWVDSRWLGRRFRNVDAVKRFLAELQTATGERELVERAEAGLSTLFHAPIRVDLELRRTDESDFTSVQDVPIHSGDRQTGAIRMGRRANHMPYFSEDIALLASLGDVFSYMLENVRLQLKKQEQEQRTQELAHQASLSELKALRAQINPHFLFNALNAIAGLIHKDPFRADSTIEQLAEVFRYTLRGSEKEWARLEDEMEFVEAYLAVERARFGERLQVGIDADEDVRSARIPTMVIQTLVENAVKHGIAAVRGQARVNVRACRKGDGLLIEVTDNGPGFPKADEPPRRQGVKGSSFGLKSIRERFLGYFGDRATLTVERDDARGLTTVRLTMPLDHSYGSEPLKSPGSAPGGSAGVA